MRPPVPVSPGDAATCTFGLSIVKSWRMSWAFNAMVTGSPAFTVISFGVNSKDLALTSTVRAPATVPLDFAWS